ncbi:hypothetical protein DLAC_05518 [Tieghemostelium lacteum]|uniref:F-box domain-containing protein n=1 Tax=Tieghemostelium lacteum TaxID=361077 RepID=A0A151ZG71_TIELA|nr:hypothetical protein DLAC_05518 [Tieghemostelium lacteum]|eukprot:KYQ92925.1 hypothetical protein DLAC_05518 [Tieghemostelium lacteum]
MTIPLPNYIVVKILDYIVINVKDIYMKSFLLKIALVCKSWNENIIPKLNNKNFYFSIEYKKNLYFLKILVKRNIGGYNFRVYSNSELYLEIKSDQQTYKVLPEHHLANPYLSIDTDQEDHVEKLEFLSKHFGFIDRLDITHPGTTTSRYNQPFQLFEKLKNRSLMPNLKVLDFNCIKIKVTDLVDLIDKVQPESVTLRSTPYGHEVPIIKLDALYSYMITNKTMKHFSVFNYFCEGSKKLAMDIINQNEVLEEISFTNMNKEPLQPDIKFNNPNLKKFYIDGEISDYLVKWICPSRLESIKFKTLGQEEYQSIILYHRNVKSLSFSEIPDIKLLINIIRADLKYTSLSISGAIKIDQLFIEALLSNQYLTSLVIYGELDNESLGMFFRCQHPTITYLQFIYSSPDSFPGISDDLSKNQTLKSIVFNEPSKVKSKSLPPPPPSYTILYEHIIKVLQNSSIQKFQFPFLHMPTGLTSKEFQQIRELVDKRPDIYSINIATNGSNTLLEPIKLKLREKQVEFTF